MAAFQNTREQTEQKVMMHLLSEIERNPSFTQRKLADELGIALGLINQYLKRSVTKGWLRISQLSPRRITYFLTPEGLKEKGQMVADYLSRSLTFFRDARVQCEAVFAECRESGLEKIALVGSGDLADIAKLVAQGTGIEVFIVEKEADFEPYQAIFITDVMDPQGTYEFVRTTVEEHKILTLKLLHISRGTS
jgi:DNA-binding MarR family transcriptional regulator